MKKIYLYLFLISSLSSNSQRRGLKIEEFKKNKIVSTFGNNVKLRSKPNTESDVLTFLKIGEQLTILEEVNDAYYKYNGIYWKWYKVKYQDEIGFVIGGLLSQQTKHINGNTYVTTIKRIKNTEHLIFRAINEDKKYYENSVILRNKIKYQDKDEIGFYTIEVYDNQGIKNIKNIVLLNIYCIDFGHYCEYFFNDGKSLKKVIKTKYIEDGEIFQNEILIFPNEKEGKEGKIIYNLYKEELGTEIENYKEEFNWNGKIFKPKIKK